MSTANITIFMFVQDTVLLNYALISLSSFVFGTAVGWSLAKNLDEIEQSQVRKLMAVVMLGAYVISIFADITMSGYQTPFLLHTIMGGIFGYLFKSGIIQFSNG